MAMQLADLIENEFGPREIELGVKQPGGLLTYADPQIAKVAEAQPASGATHREPGQDADGRVNGRYL